MHLGLDDSIRRRGHIKTVDLITRDVRIVLEQKQMTLRGKILLGGWVNWICRCWKENEEASLSGGKTPL